MLKRRQNHASYDFKDLSLTTKQSFAYADQPDGAPAARAKNNLLRKFNKHTFNELMRTSHLLNQHELEAMEDEYWLFLLRHSDLKFCSNTLFLKKVSSQPILDRTIQFLE